MRITQSPSSEAEYTALAVGNQTLYLDVQQTALLDTVVAERNSSFIEQVEKLHSSPSLENSDLTTFVNSLRDTAIAAFAEPSLRGMRMGKVEQDLLRAYQQAATEVVARHGEDPLRFQFLDTVHTEIATQQSIMQAHGIEAGDTQYWHFTARIRDLAKLGLLKSGAHPDITNFTGDHSEGVHFVRPNNAYNSWVTEWKDFAQRTHTLQGQRIPQAFGAAVIAPLAYLAHVTPLRSEHKVISDTQQPFANDVTFRTTEGSALYSYPLADTYIVPFKGDDQRQYMDLSRTAAEALRNMFTRAGYDQRWISRHIINTPASTRQESTKKQTPLKVGESILEASGYVMDNPLFRSPKDSDFIDRGDDIGHAIARCALRTASKYAGIVVAPLTSQPGAWEILDGSPNPRIERLIVTKTDPAARPPMPEDNPRITPSPRNSYLTADSKYPMLDISELTV